MSNRGRTNNSRYRKDTLRKEAVERQDYRNNISAKKQLERLDNRLGNNIGAKKERARLQKLLAQSN